MGSLLRLAAGIALAVVVLLMGLLQVPLVVAVVAMAASVVFTLWAVKSKGPAELRKQLAAALLARSPAPESAPVAAAAAAAAVPVAAPAGGGPGAIEQLQRLAELRKLGAITEVEFEAKKADLLARV
jgi:Flp pilus assembly protein TadB